MANMRASDKSPEENYNCKKYNKKFRYEGHANLYVCKQWLRWRILDMWHENHIRHEHPEHYVKDKLDGYKVLREDCINGVIDFDMKLRVYAETISLYQAEDRQFDNPSTTSLKCVVFFLFI